jgi:hypothetical protein
LAKVLDLLEVALAGDRVEDPVLEGPPLGTLSLQDDPHVCLSGHHEGLHNIGPCKEIVIILFLLKEATLTHKNLFTIL